MTDLTVEQIYDLLLERTKALSKASCHAKIPPPIYEVGTKHRTMATKYLYVVFEWQCGALCLVKVWVTAEEYSYRCFNTNEGYLDPEYAQECTDGVKFNTAEEVIEWLERKGVRKRRNQI